MSKLLLLLGFLYCENDCIDGKNVTVPFVQDRHDRALTGAVRVAILVSYMYRGDGRRNFDAVGEGRREKFIFQIFFPLPPKLCPSPRQTLRESDGRGSLILLLCRNCDSGIPVCTEVPDRPTELAGYPV